MTANLHLLVIKGMLSRLYGFSHYESQRILTEILQEIIIFKEIIQRCNITQRKFGKHCAPSSKLLIEHVKPNGTMWIQHLFLDICWKCNIIQLLY